MEVLVSLEGYTASLCYGSCRKERSKTKMVRNIFLNKIETTCSIQESLYFLPHKDYHESLSASKILVFRLPITRTTLIHCNKLCSTCIGPCPFALLSIARFLSTLGLFVAFFFTIGAKDLCSMSVVIRRAGDRSINLLRLSRSGRCWTSTHWQMESFYVM